jgi:hypothetical protein
MLIAFLVTHLYLITTGTTVTSNLKALLTGYEELENEEGDEDETNKEDLETLNSKI